MDQLVVTKLQIAGRSIGEDQPCFVIAEAGVNHNGSVDMAVELINVAAAAGADAVKFQAFRAEQLATPSAPKAQYQRRSGEAGESQLDMLRRLELGKDAFAILAAHAAKRRIVFLASVFDEESADGLEELGVPAYKIPSGELTNCGLLAHVARKGVPMIVSTGMATLEEVRQAVAVCAEAGNRQLALLHCVSSYPADPADANLRVLETLRREFDLPVGYSDHTEGAAVAVAAVALGACVLEKHFTLSADLPGPDHRASLEPTQLKELVRAVRTVEAARGDGIKRPAAAEIETAAVARKSLVAATDIPSGTKLTVELIALRRPGSGLAPALLPRLVGRVASCRIAAGELLSFEMLR